MKKKQLLCSDSDLAYISSVIHSIMNRTIQTHLIVQKSEVITFELSALERELERESVDEISYFMIASNKELWLTRIDFGSIFAEILPENYDAYTPNISLWIEENCSTNFLAPREIFRCTFGKLKGIILDSIQIKANTFTYRVFTKIEQFSSESSVVVDASIRNSLVNNITSGTQILFKKNHNKGVLAKTLFFKI